jgi:hypothetical protein
MTNRTYGLVAAALCAAGTVSAVALAYELRAPIAVPYSESFMTAHELVQTEPATSLTSTEAPFVIELPPMVVVAGPAVAPVAPVRDITEMRCGGWVSLEQGPETGRVRLCQ